MPDFRPILTALLFLCLLCGCIPLKDAPAVTSQANTPVTINVMAAASLTEAFSEIGQLYEQRNPESKVTFIFAGSQQLAQQLEQGAPADIFASANSTQIEKLVEMGSIDAAEVSIFAQNRLVIIYPRDSLIPIESFEDLRRPHLKLVLAASEVPAGQYSLEALKRASQPGAEGASFQEDVLNNVVSYENNVRIVLTKVTLGEADAGMVYISDVSSQVAEKVGQIPIPDAYNPAALYPIAVMKDSQHPRQAQAFVDMVLSAEGQKILERYGFEPADQTRR